MKIRLWGVRGSIPTTGPETEYYGGNTSCVAVWHEDSLLVLDGGTGIRGLGSSVIPSIKRIDILLTHLHLDHIQGLGFFSPLFDRFQRSSYLGSAERFPVFVFTPTADIFLRLCFRCCCVISLQTLVHEIGNSQISSRSFRDSIGLYYSSRPTLGYRVMEKETVFAYLPDHEPALGGTE